MQCSPHDIKEQLVRALDQDHNVVDMVAVLNCISKLETFPIRREDLEKTRLGRVINELRKKTSDVSLQRRAKDLVRNWRKLLNDIPNSIPSIVSSNNNINSNINNNNNKVSSPALSSSGQTSRVAQLQQSAGVFPGRTTSPARSSSVSNSPVLRTRNGSGFKPVSPAIPGSPSPNTVAPLASHVQTPSASRAPNKNNVANKRLRKPESPPESAKRARTANGFDSLLSNNSNHATTTTTTHHNNNSTTGIPSGNSAFESLVRPDSRTGSVHSDDATSNGGISSSTRIVPKVKTTQQLIDELKAKSGCNVSIDDVVREPAPPERIITPVVRNNKRRTISQTPARASPPTHPNARQQAADNNENFNRLLKNSFDARDVTKSKSELMDRFLQSSPQSNSDESNHHVEQNGHHHPTPLTNGTALVGVSLSNSFSSGVAPMVTVVDIEDDIQKIMAQLPPIANGTEVLREFDEPPSEQLFPPRTSAPTEEEVDRISNGQWPCVNGNYDMNGTWRPWNQMMMAKSAGEEPLPVLPYVDIDW